MYSVCDEQVEYPFLSKLVPQSAMEQEVAIAEENRRGKTNKVNILKVRILKS
jgi:hypothetical protein